MNIINNSQNTYRITRTHSFNHQIPEDLRGVIFSFLSTRDRTFIRCTDRENSILVEKLFYGKRDLNYMAETRDYLARTSEIKKSLDLLLEQEIRILKAIHLVKISINNFNALKDDFELLDLDKANLMYLTKQLEPLHQEIKKQRQYSMVYVPNGMNSAIIRYLNEEHIIDLFGGGKLLESLPVFEIASHKDIRSTRIRSKDLSASIMRGNNHGSIWIAFKNGVLGVKCCSIIFQDVTKSRTWIYKKFTIPKNSHSIVEEGKPTPLYTLIKNAIRASFKKTASSAKPIDNHRSDRL